MKRIGNAKNGYKRWTADEDTLLIELVHKGKTTDQISRKLKRTKPSVWTRKSQLEVEGRIKSSRTGKKYPRETSENTTEVFAEQVPSNLKMSMMEAISKIAKKNGVKATFVIFE
jgi:transposase